MLDEISPSPHHVITAACMRALTNLAGSLRKGGGGQQTRVGAVRSLLSSYLQQVCGCGMWVCVGGEGSRRASGWFEWAG